MRNIRLVSIKKDDSILSALKRMDKVGSKLLIVLEHDQFVGLLSIGDIQRAIIAKTDLDTPVINIIRKNVKVAYENDDINEVKDQMRKRRNEFMPILRSNGQIKEVIFWEDLFGTASKIQKLPHKLPVVIMAGGTGSRLKPLTYVLPKPLIPLSDKTILEEIMDRFVEVGCNNFYLSLNYKAEMIKHYFQVLNNQNYSIDYFQEEKPLGTIGSLYLIKNEIDTTFFVSNCDILIEQELYEIYDFHKNSGNELTIVAALKHYKIPYGTVETKTNGALEKLTEKPELTFQINSGMYILEPGLLNEIPVDTFYNITDIIEKLRLNGRKVGVFPVSEGSWKDIGKWDEYFKNVLHK